MTDIVDKPLVWESTDAVVKAMDSDRYLDALADLRDEFTKLRSSTDGATAYAGALGLEVVAKLAAKAAQHP